MRYFWRAIWNTAELCDISLGRAAPFVLGMAFGANEWGRAEVEWEKEERS